MCKKIRLEVFFFVICIAFNNKHAGTFFQWRDLYINLFQYEWQKKYFLLFQLPTLPFLTLTITSEALCYLFPLPPPADLKARNKKNKSFNRMKEKQREQWNFEFVSQEPGWFLNNVQFLIITPSLLMSRHSYITLTNQSRIYLILPQLSSVLLVMSKYVSGLQIYSETPI